MRILFWCKIYPHVGFIAAMAACRGSFDPLGMFGILDLGRRCIGIRVLFGQGAGYQHFSFIATVLAFTYLFDLFDFWGHGVSFEKIL